MLHLLMLGGGLSGAIGLRWVWQRRAGQSWQSRWNTALMAFAVPPLLLLTTAIALLWMGPICHMAGLAVHGWAGELPHGLAGGYLALILGCMVQLGVNAGRSARQLRQYPAVTLAVSGPAVEGDATARLLPLLLPVIAQVGLWQPQLVVSQGLLTQLDAAQLTAVLHHEAAHRYYGDTLWFAVLGLLRRSTAWLPQTRSLWRELLLLRELRADRWAAQRVEPLLLAEALYTVVSAPRSLSFSVGFNETLVHDRLSERVDALLDASLENTDPTDRVNLRQWAWGLALLPLLTIVLHH